MRSNVLRLAGWAPLAEEGDWTEDDLDRLLADIQNVRGPVTVEEARALVPLLLRPHEDSLFGLMYLIMDLIESTDYSEWQPEPASEEDGYWLFLLYQRWQNQLRWGNSGP